MAHTPDSAPPRPLRAVLPIIRPHLERLGGALEDAWASFAQVRAASSSQIAQAGAGARGMLVADFLRAPVHRRFAGIPGVWVDDRYGRPWVNLDGARVQIRFKKLTPQLGICPSDTDRHTRLAFHLGDPWLPGVPAATVLTAGYVLSPAEHQLQHLALVCHLGSVVHYSVRLPGGRQADEPVTQLPLTPLSAPVIRSARTAARNRLEREHRSQ